MVATEQLALFANLPDHPIHEVTFKGIKNALWTESKAKLVARYLRYFVFITRHGCYIDGFAGPRQQDVPGTWAAELVLDSEPRFLREFFLCDVEQKQIAHLRQLRQRQPEVKGRTIDIRQGDFNQLIHGILREGVTPKKATFCLIDQFTAECHWATVEAIANHKTDTSKIELFYFLASGWLDRALSGFTKNRHIPERWWGRDDWPELRKMKSIDRAHLLCNRFKAELGYAYATPWPILERADGGRVMFHMIHATDHPEAPKLMARAYKAVAAPSEDQGQMDLPFDEFSNIAKSYSD